MTAPHGWILSYHGIARGMQRKGSLMTGVAVLHVALFINAIMGTDIHPTPDVSRVIQVRVLNAAPGPGVVAPKPVDVKPRMTEQAAPGKPVVSSTPIVPHASTKAAPVERVAPTSQSISTAGATAGGQPGALSSSGPAVSGSAGHVTPPRVDASFLDNPKPTYPAFSRRLGEQGRVQLLVYILPNGTVGEIKVKQSSGFSRLDQAALETVRRWRYVPARRGNDPIPYWYVQPVTFSLNT